MDEDQPSDAPGKAPAGDRLLYTLSLPERAIRSTVGLVGGVVRESTTLLIPHALRDCQTYRAFVQQTLDFLVQDVGGIAATAAGPNASPRVDQYLARKTVGNFVELAGLATVHVSPLLVLAAVSDLAYGSKAYLNELAAELRRAGVIEGDSTINSTGELLDALGATAAAASSAFDTPPLSLDGIRQTIQQTADAALRIDVAKALPQAELTRLWDEMRHLADSERVSLLEVSGAMTLHALERIAGIGRGALSSVRVAGNLLDRHVIDYYRDALGEIRAGGYYATIAKVSGPYIEGVWHNFSSARSSITEELLSGRLIGQGVDAATQWLGRTGKADGAIDDSERPPESNPAP
ncbi:MAG: hypothetical protein IT424_16235 [Pirellulales bacterium]|nr:hypothetical protein [Pirellulales bacterium]